ncbi:MAG: hypothetical protein U0822_24815 [Anaerolineae bacterium]
MGTYTGTRDAPSHLLDVSLAELIVGLPIAFAAAVILASYLLDLAGWPIDQHPVFALVLITSALAVFVMWRWGPPVKLRAGWGEIGGLAVILAGLPLYIYWLGGSTWIPPSGSVDAPHHLLLINFIRNYASLPHDPDLWRYLGEFYTYSPGSHILAALAGRALGMPSLYTIEPILALVATLRAAVFYLIALRLLPALRVRPLLALAGTILLLVAYWYVINSFLWFFFYAQVVSELFALAMLWALIAWNDRPWFGPLAFFSLCGVAVWLTWPVWLPVPTLTLAGLLLLRRDLSLWRRAAIFGLTMLPVAIVAAAYTVGRANQLVILAAEGGVTQASVEVFGWPLLILAAAGMVVSRQRTNMRAVWFYTGALLAQTVALAVLDTVHQVETYYQTYKMFYLLVYPLGLFATVGLTSLWQVAARRWPRAGLPLAASLPVLAVALALWNGLTFRPLPETESLTFNEPLYGAVTWTRQNLPGACVDYLVNYAITAYWLHLELGNPRVNDRTSQAINFYEQRLNTPNRWDRPRGLPYAIVENMGEVPDDVRRHFKVLYESPPAAVVYRTGECDEDVVLLQDHPIAPRTDTLAARFDQLLGTHLAAY